MVRNTCWERATWRHPTYMTYFDCRLSMYYIYIYIWFQESLSSPPILQLPLDNFVWNVWTAALGEQLGDVGLHHFHSNAKKHPVALMATTCECQAMPCWETWCLLFVKIGSPRDCKINMLKYKGNDRPSQLISQRQHHIEVNLYMCFWNLTTRTANQWATFWSIIKQPFKSCFWFSNVQKGNAVDGKKPAPIRGYGNVLLLG